MARPDSDNNNDNNNFFNKNPLITFAIFSIVIIMVFKALIGDGGTIGDQMGGTNASRSQDISYADLKKKIELRELHKGVYFIAVYYKNNKLTRKIIIN